MPLIDMPLEALRQYQGLNPCPPDMDAFWEEALEEMRAVDPQVELVPADFTTSFADCFDMWFTGVRGARIHAKLLRPKKAQGKALPCCSSTDIPAIVATGRKSWGMWRPVLWLPHSIAAVRAVCPRTSAA